MLNILYEDNHLIAVDKPAGLLTQPTEDCAESLEQLVKNYIKERYQKPGAVYLHAVHRLDKPVSGIVIFAKTSKALSRLNASQREQEWRKIYQAEVEGAFPQQEGALTHYLKHDDYKTQISDKPAPGYKEAKLHYKVLEQRKASTILEIELETGRYHQIRAQLAFAGHPIIGDSKYGSKQSLSNGAIALRHTRLEFPHPVRQERIVINVVG